MTDTPDWLGPALAYIPEWLAYQMRTSEQPGCAVGIAYRGEIVLEAAFGHADLAAGEKLTPRHRFRVASHSKSFTAAAIMKLREQGRLKLEEPVSLYVEGLHQDIAPATIGQLLSHTAGVVRDGPDGAYWAERAAFLDKASLLAELSAPPVIDANTRLKYSNHGFGLAGLVIESITGERYGAWLEREIIAPAKLSETTPDAPTPSGVELAQGHGGKALLGRRLVIPSGQPTHALASATGFISTAADLACFFAQLSPTAETSFLTLASRREMVRPQWKDPFSPIPFTYGLGTISGAFDGWDWFGHSGGFPGHITRTAVVPEQQLSISCLTNAVDGMSHLWLDGILAILKRFSEEGAPAPALADWTGRWWSLWGASDLVAVGEKVLVASPAMTNPFLKVPELEVSGDVATIRQAGAFASYGEPARLVRGPDGAVSEVQIAASRIVKEAALAAELTERYER